jgi:hypothetical protein
LGNVVRLIVRMAGTFLYALAIGLVAWYLFLTEGWARDLE